MTPTDELMAADLAVLARIEASARRVSEGPYGRAVRAQQAKDADALSRIHDRLASPRAVEGVVTGECRYCANTGWFYGDPDLETFCGCAFGAVREDALSCLSTPSPEQAKEKGDV